MSFIWQKGRRLFTVAAILMVLTAVVHTLGQFAPPADTGEAVVVTAMRGYQIDLGLGMRPSFLDIFLTLSFTMAITFTALGLLNLAVASNRDTSRALLRRITWVNLLWVAGFSALCLIYQVLPPLIFGVLIGGILVMSLAANRKDRVGAHPLEDRSASQ